METGPIPPELTRELEALKLRLAAMQGNDLPELEASGLAAEIGAIRLHLQRLAFERNAAADAAHRAVDGRAPG
jgi:hypothetical protein